MMNPAASLILGDFNLSFDEVQALARACGGQAVRGKGPDHLIVVGDVKVLNARVLGKFGSDAHHAILFDLDVDGTLVKALLWNVWVGQRPRKVRRSLRRLIRAHRPDAIVLNEAYRCTDVLPTIKRYETHQGANIGEGADVAVLVADRHRVRLSRALRMRKTWTVVSKGRRKAGREYRSLRNRLADGPVLRILGIHFPTDNAINAAAVDESKERVVRWATKSKEKS